jgi:hypothetical protein
MLANSLTSNEKGRYGGPRNRGYFGQNATWGSETLDYRRNGRAIKTLRKRVDMEQPNLVELARHIHEQRDIAQAALDQVKKLDELIQTEGNEKKKQELQNLKDGLLIVTGKLVANAAATTSSLSSTMSVIGELARHAKR